jgi:hypothetical protein
VLDSACLDHLPGYSATMAFVSWQTSGVRWLALVPAVVHVLLPVCVLACGSPSMDAANQDHDATKSSVRCLAHEDSQRSDDSQSPDVAPTCDRSHGALGIIPIGGGAPDAGRAFQDVLTLPFADGALTSYLSTLPLFFSAINLPVSPHVVTLRL